MEQASFEEALQYSLENPDNLSISELLDRFPQYREELESLLALDARLKSDLPRGMRPSSKEMMKRRLMEKVAAQRTWPPSDAARVGQQPAQGAAPSFPRWRRPVLVLVVVSMLVGLLWWGAAPSLPGSPLYPLKLSTENVLLNLANGPIAVLRGHINLANVRLVDISTMQARKALADAGPAFENYNYHMGESLNLWNSSTDDRDVDVAKLIYASTVAGQRVLQELSGSASPLSESLRASIETTVTSVNTLNSSTAQVLTDAGVDLESVLTESQGTVANLLTAVPVPPTPTSAPTPSSTTPTLSPEPTFTSTPQLSAPTLTAILYAAQTTIADGGDASTPGIAAAETIISGGPLNTPIAQAVQTMLAQPTLPVVVEPTATITATISVTVTVLPSITPGTVLGTVSPLPSLSSVPAATGVGRTATTLVATVQPTPLLTSIPATVIPSITKTLPLGVTPVPADTLLPRSVIATVTSAVRAQPPEVPQAAVATPDVQISTTPQP
jgi:hypothetical protein